MSPNKSLPAMRDGAKKRGGKAAWGHAPLRGSRTVAVRQHSAVAPLVALAELRRGRQLYESVHSYPFLAIALRADDSRMRPSAAGGSIKLRRIGDRIADFERRDGQQMR